MGHKELCELLIEKSADIEGDEYKLLMHAARRGNKEVCGMLIEKGADVNAVNEDGRTVLMYASLYGRKEVCELLIKKGAEVNSVDKNERTALMYAAEEGNKEVCVLLINRGANMDLLDKNGDTAFMHALRSSKGGVSILLLEALSRGACFVNDRGETLLMLAVKKGDSDIFNALLNLLSGECKEIESKMKLIDIPATEIRGRNVFHYLAENARLGSERIGKFLKKARGLSSFSRDLLLQKDKDGFSPMHIAILSSNSGFIYHVSRVLTKEELDLKYKEESILDLMLKKGVDENTKKSVIENIIGKLNCDKEDLLKKISSLSSVYEGEIGKRIIDRIILRDMPDILDYVFKLGKLKEEDIGELAIVSRDLFSVKCEEYLLNKMGREMKRRDGLKEGKLSLHNLCRDGKLESIKVVLLSMKKHLMSVDKKGKLPIQIAAEEGRDDLVSFLLGYESGELNMDRCYFSKEEIEKLRKHVDIRGKSLMHSAIVNFSSHIVDLFNKIGCDSKLKDRSGKRALDCWVKLKPENEEEKKKRMETLYSLLCAMSKKEYNANLSDENIHLSLEMGEIVIVKELIREGHINKKDREGNTPLHVAMKLGGVEKLEILIDQLKSFEDYKAKNNRGETPLHLSNSVEVMKLMLSKAKENDINIKLLLQQKDSNEEPVLHSYVSSNRNEECKIELVKCAIENGADREEILRKGQYRGCDAIEIAEDKGEKSLEEFLTNYGCDTKGKVPETKSSKEN